MWSYKKHTVFGYSAHTTHNTLFWLPFKKKKKCTETGVDQTTDKLIMCWKWKPNINCLIKKVRFFSLIC